MRFLKKEEMPGVGELTGKRLKVKKFTEKCQASINKRREKESKRPPKTIIRKKSFP